MNDLATRLRTVEMVLGGQEPGNLESPKAPGEWRYERWGYDGLLTHPDSQTYPSGGRKASANLLPGTVLATPHTLSYYDIHECLLVNAPAIGKQAMGAKGKMPGRSWHSPAWRGIGYHQQPDILTSYKQKFF